MRNKILSDLYQSKELEALLNKMHPDHLRDDLKQELFLVLSSMPDEKLLSLHQSGGLRFWATRTVLNMVCSDRSTFHQMYRQTKVEFEEVPVFKKHEYITDFNEVEEMELRHSSLLSAVNKSMDSLHWYDKELFVRYIEAGSADKLVKIMKETTAHPIPKRSILNTVKRVKEQIKKEVHV